MHAQGALAHCTLPAPLHRWIDTPLAPAQSPNTIPAPRSSLQHPAFFAYFGANGSAPSALADMLCNALGTIGFSWIGSPAATELETVSRVGAAGEKCAATVWMLG